MRAFCGGPHDTPKSIIPEHQRPAHLCYTVRCMDRDIRRISDGPGATPTGPLLRDAGGCGKIHAETPRVRDTPDTSTSRPSSCVAGEMRSGPTSGLWPLARYHLLAYNTVPDGAYQLDAACLFSEGHDVMAGEVVDTFPTGPTGTPETVSDDALLQTACGMR